MLQAWKPVAIEMVGDEPIPSLNAPHDLYPSDHYGLMCDLRFAGTPGHVLGEAQWRAWMEKWCCLRAPTPLTTVIVAPPESLHAQLNDIRHRYIKPVKCMPHVTLIERFVPDEGDNMEIAVQQFSEVVRNFAAFHMTLTGYDHFTHGRSATLWLKPECEPADALARLREQLLAFYPQCAAAERPGQPFLPHMSMGRFASEAACKKVKSELARDFEPLTFPVGEIYIMTRPDVQSAYTIRAKIDFDLRTLDPRNWRHVHNHYEVALFQYSNRETGQSSVYWDWEHIAYGWNDPRDQPFDSSQAGCSSDQAPCCGARASDFDIQSAESLAAMAALEEASGRLGRNCNIYRHRFLGGSLRGCRFLPDGRSPPKELEPYLQE
eukprot:TRINITY_DN11160_c0_g2_i2.p1 TRINITY_DN11160_c0_g2~~TRINITY_DN11160_c0_g2_i2.p1  ORF type:complete len:378 (+),score=35.75 TRINITY_DN11160_c0_g2_i2:64-1197(+)